MEICGIICEYNPFHLGHQKQLSAVRQHLPNAGIVALMSGNYVQRGAPAIFDKSLRAEAAVNAGADLVLELPVTVSLSSAEGFASEGVRILSGFCTHLCFGAETGTKDSLMQTAETLLSPAFSEALRKELDKGLSFPAARQAALGDDILTQPNDILAVEYCKAILNQRACLEPLVIRRQGSYHAQTADPNNPSATAIRQLILNENNWEDYVPENTRHCFRNATPHSIQAGEKAVLARLRTMNDDQFESLPYGSEGLWRKFMHAVRSCATLEEILAAVKSKRYTRTRLDRMVMCAYLGITRETLDSPAPYIRVLAFNDKGREILNVARESGAFINAGQKTDTEYELFEKNCGALFSLFAQVPGKPDSESTRRIRRIV